MRKSRFVVREADITGVIDNLGLNLNELLTKFNLVYPEWATMAFAFIRTERKIVDVSFFEDGKDFFLWYSKVMIRRSDDLMSVSYSKVESEWKLFMPPTLIGMNLSTRLRF